MNQLVTIYNNNILITDTLKIAIKFEKEHKNVLRSIENLECSEEFGRLNFERTYYIDEWNREKPMYLMTQDGFAFLAMGYTGSKAAKFKEEYINEFNRMKFELANLNKPKLPQSFAEALRLAADQQEQIEQLALESQRKQELIEEQAPKVDYVDKILSSNLVMNISQIAKDYGMSGKKLNEILKEEKIQYRQGKQWLLFSKYQDKNYVKSSTDMNANGEYTFVQTKWTQKGRLFIHEILKKRDIHPNEA